MTLTFYRRISLICRSKAVHSDRKVVYTLTASQLNYLSRGSIYRFRFLRCPILHLTFEFSLHICMTFAPFTFRTCSSSLFLLVTTQHSSLVRGHALLEIDFVYFVRYFGGTFTA